MKRDEAAQVQIHVVAVADFLQGANHGEADAVEQNGGADGWTPWKQRAPNFVADDDYGALLRIVHGIDPAAFVDRKVANLVDVGGHAHDLAAGLEKVAHRSDVVAGYYGGSRADAGAFAKNVFVIFVSQIVLAQGGEAALHYGSATGPDEHYVLAQGIELLAIAGTESFAQADQQQQGTDAPGDAEHGEERAQFVRPEGAEGLPDRCRR